MATRSRSRTTIGPTDGTSKLYAWTNATKSFPLGGWNPKAYTVLLAEASETIDDENVIGFHRKSAAGQVIVNPVSHVKDSFRSIGTGRYYWTRNNGYVYEYNGPNLTDSIRQYAPWQGCTLLEPEDEAAYMEASVKLQAMASVDRAPYSFAEDIAELHKTLRFLKAPLASLKKLGDTFGRQVGSQLKQNKNLRRIDAIADIWLQYQFAVMPLIRSANDLIEAVGVKTTRPIRRTARGVREFAYSDADVWQNASLWDWGRTVEFSSTHRAGIIYEVTNPLNDWQFKYGLRFKDIPETLWAIFPYSFMIDRVTNITQAVRGLESFLDPNVKYLGAWSSIKKNTIQTKSFQGFSSHGIVVSVQKAEWDVEEYTQQSYTRTPWEPVLKDLVPPVEISGLTNDITKIADLAALVWAGFR
jgi:hypothetical protein